MSKLSLNHPFVRILTHELHQYIGAFADRAMVQALEEHESFEALLDQVALVVHEDNRDYFVLNCVDAVRQTLRDTAAHRAQAWSQGDA